MYIGACIYVVRVYRYPPFYAVQGTSADISDYLLATYNDAHDPRLGALATPDLVQLNVSASIASLTLAGGSAAGGAAPNTAGAAVVVAAAARSFLRCDALRY